ncbi:MAG TPA: DUF2157 domain-containing protein [Actinomycetes bacterium]
MTSTHTGRRRGAQDLSAQLDRWVGDRLLTDEQARRILAHEQETKLAAGDVPSARPGGRLVVEALAYLGGVIALAAGLLLVQLVWSDLSGGVRLAVPLSAAAVLLLSGLLVPGEAPERRRLRSALWALGTAAWMVALAVLGDQVLEADTQDTLLLTGLGGSALALRLYVTCRGALQQLVLLITASLAAAALADRAGWDEPTLLGLAVWLVAAAWFGLGERGVLTPPDIVRYSAAAGLVVGALMTQGSLGGQLVAAGTVTFLLARGVATDRIGLVVVAAVAALNMIPLAVQFFFPDGGRLVVPLVLLAVGLVLVGTAVTVTRRRSG